MSILLIDRKPVMVNNKLILGNDGGEEIPYLDYGGGSNPELLYEYNESWGLGDTSFVIGESASTAATSIKATVSNRFTTPTITYGDYDYVVIQKCKCTPTYNGSEVDKAKQLGYGIIYVSHIAKRKTNDTSALTTRVILNLSTYLNSYYNTSGTLSRAVANYGFYMTPQAPTQSSATAATGTFRVSSPILYYRVSTSYLTADNIKAVTSCSFDWNLKIYRTDFQSGLCAKYYTDIDTLLLDR